MKKQMELLALYLSKPLERHEIENVLNITFTKKIEATYYVEIDDMLLTYSQFNVLTFINWPKDKIAETLEMLEIEERDTRSESTIFQDYPIRIDAGLSSSFAIDNDKITLKEYTIINLIIVSHVISQSVALELYEQKLSDYYEKSRNLIDAADTFSFYKRTRLARFAKQLVLIRHDMLIDLHLLDKPNILWDHEDAENLYNALAATLELKARFDIVEYKLNNIKDDIVMVMDLMNHNHSSFLEWIIIVLILIEIIMGLIEWFGPGFKH